MQLTQSIREGMNKILSGFHITLFGFMVLVGTYQILVRYLLNKPSTVSEELLTYSFTWMSLLAAAHVFGLRGHMRMGFFADKLQAHVRKWLNLLIEGIIFTFSAVVLVYGGIQITSLTMSQKTASLGIPMGYVYMVIPICGFLILIYTILNIVEELSGKEPVREAIRKGDRV